MLASARVDMPTRATSGSARVSDSNAEHPRREIFQITAPNSLRGPRAADEMNSRGLAGWWRWAERAVRPKGEKDKPAGPRDSVSATHSNSASSAQGLAKSRLAHRHRHLRRNMMGTTNLPGPACYRNE
ncbi:hypothetical protein ACLOJK_002616 [Asimina triloba]